VHAHVPFAIAVFVALAFVGCSPGGGPDKGGAAASQPGSSSPPSSQAGGEGACGAPGRPDCPLQSWMKANASQALGSGDFERMGRALQRIAGLAPPDYDGWRDIALNGASAASARNLEGVRGACKACHEEHRARYRKELRAHALP
jgi:hypothetical protein